MSERWRTNKGGNGKSNGNNGNFAGAKRIFIQRKGQRGYLALFDACRKYNPDEDPNGAIGQGLAEAVHSRTGGFDISKLVESSQEEQEPKTEENRAYWAIVAGIALPRFPELDRGERVSDSEVKKKLLRLSTAGYDVGNPRALTEMGRWDLLQAIRRDIYRKASEYCPEVVKRIEYKNRINKNIR